MTAGSAPPLVRVEVLGPLRLLVEGSPVEVPGPKRRATLALLALAEGRVVTADDLVDALWPSEVPESGRQALHNHVSRLRAHLGPAAVRLETRHDGYRLGLDGDELDVVQARRSLSAARTMARDDAAGAAGLLRETHALWQGPVLADLTDTIAVATAAEEYAQLHREVTDLLISCAIAAGEADRVLGLATASSAADPLREPAVRLLMRALAATGQAPEALRVARAYRNRLVEETGLDPAPALGELERDILHGTAVPTGPGSPAAPARAAPGGHGPSPGSPATGSSGSPGSVGAAGAPVWPATRLIGREAQVAAVRSLLSAERLVTIIGPGGVGKTRVALEVARQSDAAAVLLLAPVADAGAIPHALAAALDLRVVQGEVLSACTAVLGTGPGLLVVDNCEHLLDGIRDVVGMILSACPRISVLATSREPLGLTAEYASRLAPLPLPGPEQDPSQVPSVELFLERARRVRPGSAPTPGDLREVADIVRRLDGMPLAIELAAGRLSTFSLADLRGRLGRSLDLLGDGRPGADSRHRTLRATVEWSYRLLTEDERRLFRHLSMFVDGVDLDTAERLAAGLGLGSDPGSVLARLVDTSMIDAAFEGNTRYRMLDTLRAYGLDRLAAEGEVDAAVAHLARWAAGLTAWIGDTLNTRHEPEADAVLRRELPNLRAAWRLARDRGALEDALAILLPLYDAVSYRDLLEIRDWAEQLAGDPAMAGHPRSAAVLATAAEAVYHRGDYREADRLARAGLEIATGNGDQWRCLSALSVADLARAAYADVVEHSLAAAVLAGRPRENLGLAALATAYAGEVDRARELNDRGAAGLESPTLLSWAAYVAGEIEGVAGDSETAERHYARAIELARTSGATFLVGVATVGLLSVRARAGRVPEALSGYRDVIDYFTRTRNWTHLWVALRNLADLLRRLGDEEPAALIAAVSDQAPDAPAMGPGSPAAGSGAESGAECGLGTPAEPAAPIPDRDTVLRVARQAIERHLRLSPARE